jgi:cytochrome b
MAHSSSRAQKFLSEWAVLADYVKNNEPNTLTVRHWDLGARIQTWVVVGAIVQELNKKRASE